MRDLYLYASAFLPHWWPLVSAGSLLGFEEFAERYWKWASERIKKVPDGARNTTKVCALIVATFYSGYLAWDNEYRAFQTEHNARQKAEGERDETQRQLEASTPSELQRRIDELEAEKNAARWAPLTPDEIAALQSQLSKIPPEPVEIVCPTINCKDLTEGLAKAFKGAGWKNITLIFHGGVVMTGVTGLLMEPAEKQTDEIIAAVEKTTPLKIHPPQYKRSGSFAAGLFFAIGEKPF